MALLTTISISIINEQTNRYVGSLTVEVRTGEVVAEVKETHSFTSTHIFCFCLLHTYDKQYNVTRSSRYGILENFHYPLLQLLFDILFRHISSTLCICVSYTRIVQEGRKKKENKRKEGR